MWFKKLPGWKSDNSTKSRRRIIVEDETEASARDFLASFDEENEEEEGREEDDNDDDEETPLVKKQDSKPRMSILESLRSPQSSPFIQKHPLLLPSKSKRSFRRGYSTQSSTTSFDLQEDEQKQLLRQQVTYDSKNHISVLSQMHGSVWPSVLPFALANVLVTYVVAYLKHRQGIDVTLPSDGHNFMAMMVSFLIVTRAQITYARFMEARGNLSTCYRTCRELIQTMSVLTMEDQGEGAKQWRQDVAYRTILLLRVTMAALDYQSSQINTWEVMTTKDKPMELMLSPNTKDDPKTKTPSSETDDVTTTTSSIDNDNTKTAAATAAPLPPSSAQYHSSEAINNRIMKWAHGERTLSDENFRAPIILAYNLRHDIMKQRDGNYLTKKMFPPDFMHVNEELKILGFVNDYIKAFHGLKKLITTPFPFPLVQMARTFLFFWIFTLPFALNRDVDEPVQMMIIIFFTTYGFIGLEYVSMEIDDPFGDDPNDFDDLGMAQMVFEDIYITIFKTDGPESAENLRKKISKRTKTSALENYQDDFQRDLKTKSDQERAAEEAAARRTHDFNMAIIEE